jgi:RNA-binding protein YlmH
MLGDIVIDQGTDKASKAGDAYVFVAEHMADYIVDNLMNVKHTAVDVAIVEELPEGLGAVKEEKQLVISSNRLDAIIARVFGMSREAAAELISDGRIFINGRSFLKKEKSLTEGDRVSVRGYGKFIFVSENGKTKKDRLMITVEIYR